MGKRKKDAMSILLAISAILSATDFEIGVHTGDGTMFLRDIRTGNDYELKKMENRNEHDSKTD